MSIVYLSLGSNMGNREEILEVAIKEIDKRIGKISKSSSKYETEPWGFTSPNKFINMAIEVETQLSPTLVSEIAHSIEDDLGRIRNKDIEGYEDRVIDIDILMIDNIISNDKGLTLPHPKMHLREFVILPLCEIAPKTIHPLLQKTIEEIKNNITTQNSI
ncbi:MAG: 2-amino-4-hydroxy-6-hydroxymethyldihydropteridine diphosphokinase [Muribaculaceae bacterium]|nr:2-amino-4-hydroxy-6-hydroxymethyldihydropteridine diphosphokinase [Bacteroidales bacterium]MBR5240405.1 2-amino-4-hydroxy-6-hydroxymethyldihydropteridine diphosphokinase [Muribaculaceae bacterium]